jgi:MoaD family protein
MNIRIRFYNILGDAAGKREEVRTVAAGQTLAGLLADVAAAYPRVGELVYLKSGALSPYVRIFVNGKVADAGQADRPLADGDEVYLFPAVAGG